MCLSHHASVLQRAAFLEEDREMEDAHSAAATAGDTEVILIGLMSRILSICDTKRQDHIQQLIYVKLFGISCLSFYNPFNATNAVNSFSQLLLHFNMISTQLTFTYLKVN